MEVGPKLTLSPLVTDSWLSPVNLAGAVVQSFMCVSQSLILTWRMVHLRVTGTEHHFPVLPLQEKQITVFVPCWRGDHLMLRFIERIVKELSKGFQSHYSAWVTSMVVYIYLSVAQYHGKGVTQEDKPLNTGWDSKSSPPWSM